jgi:Predicted membrane protein
MKKYFSGAESALDGSPVILVENGTLLTEKLKKVDVSCDDILVAARQNQGITELEKIKYAILERNGHISIIPLEK